MNLKFDYVLTIRYDDSHSDYSMLCSSEMSELCFSCKDVTMYFSSEEMMVYLIHNSPRFILTLLLFQNAMYFISPIVSSSNVHICFSQMNWFLFLLLLCKFLVMVPNC